VALVNEPPGKAESTVIVVPLIAVIFLTLLLASRKNIPTFITVGIVLEAV